VNVLRQLNDSLTQQESHLFTPAAAIRLPNGVKDSPGSMGTNSPQGIVIHYWLASDLPDDADMSLEILDHNNDLIRTFTPKPAEDSKDKKPLMGDDDRKLETRAGINQFVWDLRYPSVEKFEKMILWNRSLKGARAIPGQYQATLNVGESHQTVSVELLPDPRVDTTPEEYTAQFDFVSGINHKLTETHRAITRIREAKSQLTAIEKRLGDDAKFSSLLESAVSLKEMLSSIEKNLYQTKMESRQDPLNFPISLNDKLAGVMSLAGFGDHAPSESALAVRDELVTAIDAQLKALDKVFNEDLVRFNQQAADVGMAAVGL